MKLNPNNIFARYYRWIYGALPADICSFFWGTVAIILLSPIVIIGRLIWFADHKGFKNEIRNGGNFYLVNLAMMVVGAMATSKNSESLNDLPLWKVLMFLWLIGFGIFLCIAILIALVIGIVWFAEYRKKQLRKRQKEIIATYGYDYWYDHFIAPKQKPDRVTFREKLSIWIGAIRQKHCTKIEWSEKTE